MVHDQSGSAEDRYKYKPSRQIRFKTSMLRSKLCDFSDAYIVVKGTIILTKDESRNFIDVRSRCLAFKNNALFTNCLSKVNNALIDSTEDLDFVMPMYNLLQYNKNYKKTRRSLWNYYRDEPSNFPDNYYNADSIKNVSFKYKSSIPGKASNANQENSENTEQEDTKTLKLLLR